MVLANMSKEENFLGATVRRMGAEAMGIALDRVPSNLMLDYIERKMPVGDHSLGLICSYGHY